MSKQNEIRFIDSDYNEKFRINDGDRIRITEQNGNTFERVCKYIDECHTKIGDLIFHICEYAELTERNGWTVEPVK